MYTLTNPKNEYFVLRRIEMHKIYQIEISQKKAIIFTINIQNE